MPEDDIEENDEKNVRSDPKISNKSPKFSPLKSMSQIKLEINSDRRSIDNSLDEEGYADADDVSLITNAQVMFFNI